MFRFKLVALTMLGVLGMLMAACTQTSTGPTIDVATIVSDIKAACAFEPAAASVLQVAAAVAAASGNPALVTGSVVASGIASAVEQTICAQKAAAMAANVSLKSLAKGAKETLSVTVNEVIVDGKPVKIDPITIPGTVTG